MRNPIAKLMIVEGNLRFRCKECGHDYIDYNEMIEHPTSREVGFVSTLFRLDDSIHCRYVGQRFLNPLCNFSLEQWPKIEPLRESACDQFACSGPQERTK
jgi:hypothetical protein